jgi:predicted ATPase
LDVLSLLANAARGKLDATISEMSGLAALTTYDRADSVGLGISMHVPGHEPLDYALSLNQQGNAYRIERETLTQLRPPYENPFLHIDSHNSDIKYYEIDKNKLVRPNWEHNPRETSLAQVPKMFREPEDFRQN